MHITATEPEACVQQNSCPLNTSPKRHHGIRESEKKQRIPQKR